MSQYEISSFDDFVGNTQVVNELKLLCRAHQETGEIMPHIGIWGPPGHGKTTIGIIVAKTLGRKFHYLNSVATSRPNTLRALITDPENMAKGAVIFLDESHQLPKKVQDNLLSALERPALLVTSFKDQVVTDKIPDNIMFMFATTNKALMRDTLISRLEEFELKEYSVEEKQVIAVKCLVQRMGLPPESLDVDSILEIGRIARSGRHVIKLCRNVVRVMKLNKRERLDIETVKQTCESVGLDHNGLSNTDRKMLSYLYESGQCGIDNLEAYLNIPKQQIQSVIEPWLLRNKLIVRQSAGRVITPRGISAMRGQRIEYE